MGGWSRIFGMLRLESGGEIPALEGREFTGGVLVWGRTLGMLGWDLGSAAKIIPEAPSAPGRAVGAEPPVSFLRLIPVPPGPGVPHGLGGPAG